MEGDRSPRSTRFLSLSGKGVFGLTEEISGVASRNRSSLMPTIGVFPAAIGSMLYMNNMRLPFCTAFVLRAMLSAASGEENGMPRKVFGETERLRSIRANIPLKPMRNKGFTRLFEIVSPVKG